MLNLAPSSAKIAAPSPIVKPRAGFGERLVGMARCAVTARVQRAERMHKVVRTRLRVARRTRLVALLNAARWSLDLLVAPGTETPKASLRPAHVNVQGGNLHCCQPKAFGLEIKPLGPTGRPSLARG